jgi:UDP-MurNAc hydroxylase
MLIRWVNHASFLLETGKIKLICDPWIEGTAFNNGWRLVSPTKFAYQDFAVVTHIWFSHEHPDHFSPSNLRSIPEEFRRRITVLFHRTKGQAVDQNLCCDGLHVK